IEHPAVELVLFHRETTARDQYGQRRVFAWRQVQYGAVQGKGAAFAVVDQRAALHAGYLPAPAATYERGQPGFQFLERKGFGQEIVGSEIQAAHAVLQGTL